MAFTTPYTSARRYSSSTNRFSNASKKMKVWKFRKNHGLMRYRNVHSTRSTPTDLFGDPISRQYTRKEICETQQGSEYVLQNNRYMTSYVTYPAKSRTGTDNRVRSYIKLTGLTMSGTFGIRCSDLMTDVDQPTGLYGVMSIVIVRDKSPKIYSTAQPLMPFVDLFGSVNSCRGTLKVAERHRDRFVVLNQSSILINTPHCNAMKKFSVRNCIPRTYSTWVTFKDEEEDSSTGLYSNTLRNAILIYYVWLIDVSSQLDMYSNVMLNYIG
uniref:Nuclear shuttle protein n=1 Tax=Squash leaf curl China virus TaxID=223323 RepID=A0A223M0Q5_9GEMI|nr:nuclear shuttle protein [Squash leaf curl China virus]QHG11695.1 nuclear shuttle protein [Squash leaf curl China virus]